MAEVSGVFWQVPEQSAGDGVEVSGGAIEQRLALEQAFTLPSKKPMDSADLSDGSSQHSIRKK